MTDTRLKNDDFRKLLATPSAARSGGEAASKPVLGQAQHSFTHRQTLAKTAVKPSKGKFRPKEKAKRDEDDIFSESQAQLAELMKKYRDRAAERRKGLTQEDDAELKSKITAAYKAMPSTASATASLAERRRMEIQESKYLGGDIEHTHLVKGLDYSLLNKVRDEIENAEETELEQAYEKTQQEKGAEQEATSRMAKNICRILTRADAPPKRNDMFARGRMAYVVELEPGDDSTFVYNDVPCTLLRSVADCPAEPSADASSTDALLINKLEQVLGYLRADVKKRKQRGGEAQVAATQKIYDDADDYAPSKRDSKPSSSSAYGGERRGEKGSYFESRRGDDHRSRREDRYDRDDREDRHRDRDRHQRDRDRHDEYDGRRDTDRRQTAASVTTETIVQPPQDDGATAKAAKRRRLDEEEDDAYAELYPSGIGFLDAAGGESDDEDLSKMDMGNHKGPIKRWDFETEGEYASYQEKREAMPKAAYQYGIKMNSGRKTRKNNSVVNEKKLDKELDKINKILDDRKKKGK